MIVRLTDADVHRWQDVRRGEQETFEGVRGGQRALDGVTGIPLVCGVAVRNTERWLNLMQRYLAEKLDIPLAVFVASKDCTGLIKNALKRVQRLDQNASDVVAEIVKEAPTSAFQAMLKHKSFRRFYSDCRAEALKANCEVSNELSDEDT